MSAHILPYPFGRCIGRHRLAAAGALRSRFGGIEEHVAMHLRHLRAFLEKSGLDREIIDAECASYETAIRCEIARLMNFTDAGGDSG